MDFLRFLPWSVTVSTRRMSGSSPQIHSYIRYIYSLTCCMNIQSTRLSQQHNASANRIPMDVDNMYLRSKDPVQGRLFRRIDIVILQRMQATTDSDGMCVRLNISSVVELNQTRKCIAVESSLRCLNKGVQKHDIACKVLGAECIGTSHIPLQVLFYIAIDLTVRRSVNCTLLGSP